MQLNLINHRMVHDIELGKCHVLRGPKAEEYWYLDVGPPPGVVVIKYKFLEEANKFVGRAKADESCD